MRLETIRDPRTGFISVRGIDAQGKEFEVVVQQSGDVLIQFQESTIHVVPKQVHDAG